MATTPRECQGKRLPLHLSLSLGWSPVGLTCRLTALVYVTPELSKLTHDRMHAHRHTLAELGIKQLS